eukprot:scaffold9106_cov118-Isochrysis_galbana.AAC.8
MALSLICAPHLPCLGWSHAAGEFDRGPRRTPDRPLEWMDTERAQPIQGRRGGGRHTAHGARPRAARDAADAGGASGCG